MPEEQTSSARGESSAYLSNSAHAQKIAADLLAEQGRVSEAIHAYLAAIDANPDVVAPYMGLARTLESAGRLEEALVAYREGLQANPDDFEIHAAMASLLARMRRLDESRAAHARAASLNPNAALTHQASGEIMLQKGDPTSAAESFRKAVAINPDLPAGWSQLGVALNSLGRFEEAADCFKQFIRIRPNSGMGHLNLVNTGRSAASEEIRQLEALLNRSASPVDDRIPATFALAKLLDQAERFDDAFAQYAQANALVLAQRAAAGERFDPAGFQAGVQQTIDTFTSDFFHSRRDWGNPSEIPVFITGMPRSGTTLVHQIASSYPHVHGAGERRDLIDIAMRLGGADVKNAALGWSRDRIRDAANKHLHRLHALGGYALRVIDKMPSNVHRVGLIAVLFPNARIIQCRRDPRDTCLSCYFQYFSAGNIASYDQITCAQECLATEKLMNHWRHLQPVPILDIQYEDLVTDVEAQSRRLIRFLRLEWDPQCLEFHRKRSVVTTASAWQVRQPINHHSIGRWRHYEKHLGPMLQTLGS